MQLVSIQVGRPMHRVHQGTSWYSGYAKHEVMAPVWVAAENIEGDGQADHRHHGGPDKAVLAYCAEHYPLWRAELAPLSLPYGAFAENLTIAGLSEQTACIGDIYAVGEVQLQVSQPRHPCANINKHWERADLTQRVLENGRSGWYLRVLKAGYIEPGLAVQLLERPCPEWTVTRAQGVRRHQQEDPTTARLLSECPLLSADWRTRLGAL